MAEKPMLSRTVLNHQNTLAAKQQTAVKERTSSGNDDGCKALILMKTEKLAKHQKKQLRKSGNGSSSDILALLDLYLNNEEISGKYPQRQTRKSSERFSGRMGKGPTEALKQLLQGKTSLSLTALLKIWMIMASGWKLKKSC